MRIEDRDEFVDIVAQAVIDKIEERNRIEGLVGLVVTRVLALQEEQAQAKAVLGEALVEASSGGSSQENTHARH